MEFDRELSYEEKMWVLDILGNRIDDLKQTLTVRRINVEGKCPHRNTLNITTLADPVNIKRLLCMDCDHVLVYEDGILKEVKERYYGNNENG